MMKHVKKLAGILLALIMVLGMTVTTFATGTDTSTITVKNGNPGQTYTLYKLFDATVNDARKAAEDTDESTSVMTLGINYTLPTGKSLDTEYTYTDSTAQTHTVKGTDWFLVDIAGNVTAKQNAAVSTEAFREWAKQFGTQIGDSRPVTGTAADVVFENLADGYYFITTTTGTLVTVDSVAPNAIVKDKNEVPTVDKTVSGGTAAGSATPAVNQETNTASVGDVLTYTATVHAKPGAKGYVFTDTMENGLSLQKYDADKNVQVQVNSTDLTSGTDYTIDTWTEGKGGTFKITFRQSYLDKITANTDIVITYKVMVNEDAVIADDGNVNTASLQYGDNSTTTEDSTTTYAYRFGLYKTAEIGGVEHTVLNGAKFRLYDAQTGGNEIKLVKDGEVYRPALTDEIAAAVEIEAGTATISGLKNGTYWLEETVAPDGYHKLTARTSITITDANSEGTVTENVYQSDGGLEVINEAGTVLPSTGGIGTTIFYVIGSILLIGAVVLIVIRKRIHAAK